MQDDVVVNVNVVVFPTGIVDHDAMHFAQGMQKQKVRLASTPREEKEFRKSRVD